MIAATILFIVVASIYSSKFLSVRATKFVGVFFVLGYLLYILLVSNII
jgi:hypothetical protein